MKKIIKKITFLSLLSILFNACAPLLTLTVNADEIKSEEITETDSYIENQIITNNESAPIKIEERSATGAIAIFFGGMVVGWVIEGTIKYATGKAPSEWVAWGLGKVHNYILQQVRNGARQVVVPKSGPYTCPGVVIDHSGMCP